jgi:hypothetical protein
MSIFDDNSIDRVDEVVYKKYFDNTNTMISAITFMDFIDKRLRPCNKRKKGSFVFFFWDSSRSTFIFVENGYIKYSLYYKSHSYKIRSGEADDGIIMRYDYSHEPRRYEFAKYNFGESERFEYYNLEKSDIDIFHAIIFNHEYI